MLLGKLSRVADANDAARRISPKMNAGKATEAMIDFSDLGGILMISRLISPRRTRSSWYAIASRCQLLIKVWPGVRVIKTFSTKTLKSLRNRACSRRPSEVIALLSC